MKIVKVKSYEEMSSVVADLIIAEVNANPKTVLGLATGSTPVGVYKLIAEAYKKGEVDFSQVTTVNLDEYCGLSSDNPQSYRYYMNENLFKHINVNKANIHIPDGAASDPFAEAERYESLIESLGGIDLQLLGMGHNGHIAFIEPGGELPAKTHQARLTEQTIKANSRFFKESEEVPVSAISMGIKTIMNAGKIIFAVNGNQKCEVLKKALFGPVTTMIPASVLQMHNNAVTVTDCLN